MKLEKLSLVVAARNDDFGGRFIPRMSNFLNCIALAPTKPRMEIIIVEWNPPSNRHRLKDIFSSPGSGFDTRIITVPDWMHHSIKGSDRSPMFEYRAKNVGIRRSTGDWILCTNPDNLFSPELLARWVEFDFQPDTYYRANRYNVRNCPRLPYCSLKDLMDHCRTNASESSCTSGPDIIFTDASGDFLLMHRDRWFELRGYSEVNSHSSLDSYMVNLAWTSGMKQATFSDPMYHMDHHRVDRDGRPDVGYTESRTMEMQNKDDSWGMNGVPLEEWSCHCGSH